jgi:hypothetical protein
LIQEIQAPSTHLAYKAMLALRDNIGPELAFADHVDKVLRPEGYRLVGFFIKEDLYAAAVAGFRLVTTSPGATPCTAMTSARDLSIGSRGTQASSWTG